MSTEHDATNRASWKSVVRVDVGRLRKAEKTPSGGVRVPGAVARAGILTYRRADGTTVRELVLPEEVRRLDSLRTLRDAVVTVGHPDGGLRLVSPDTYRRDSVGHVSGEPRVDGEHVVVDLAVQDAEAVRRIDAGDLVEISSGYRVKIDPTPGVWQGQRYDQVQREREYNHVALLPAGHGRAGASVSLRLDGDAGADAAIEVRADDDPPRKEPARQQPEMRADMATQRIDGVDYEVGSTAHTQALAKQDQSTRERIDALEKRVAELSKVEAERDAAKTKVAELEAKVTELEAPARVDALVAKRVELLDRARLILGTEAKFDGKAELDVMREALTKLEVKLDGKDDTYVRTLFEIRTDEAKAKASTSSTTSPTQARADAFRPAPTASVPAGNNKHTVGRTAPSSIR